MRRLAAVFCLALFLPACLTEQIWSWAADSYAVSPEPVAAGLNSEGVLFILVATEGESSPSFALKVPGDWRTLTELSVDSGSETVYAPILLTPSPLPAGGQGSLTPSEEMWYLRHDFSNGSVDVLTTRGDAYLTVGTAQLPSERHWERIALAALMTPVTLTIDTITFLTASIFFSWLESPFGDHDHDQDQHGHSDEPESSNDQPEGIIFPARAPSEG